MPAVRAGGDTCPKALQVPYVRIIGTIGWLFCRADGAVVGIVDTGMWFQAFGCEPKSKKVNFMACVFFCNASYFYF